MIKTLSVFTCLILIVTGVSAREVYFFREATDTSFYDQGIVDVANAGDSRFHHTHPPGAPQFNDKIPASTNAYTGTSSLKFDYTSSSNGRWNVTVYRNDWSVADISGMDSLAFFIYAEEGLPATALPFVGIRAVHSSGNGDVNSGLYDLSDYNNDIPAAKWVKVSVPLNLFFNDGLNSDMDFTSVKGVIFSQSEMDGSTRVIYLDDISAFESLGEIPVIDNIEASGYDSHTELTWDHPVEELSYRVYASYDSGNTYQVLAETTDSSYIDFVPDSALNTTVYYRVATVFQNNESAPVEISASLKTFTDDQLLDMVQQYTFRYFWEGAHSGTGTILERTNGTPSTVASGATGMGLMALIVGYEREYEPRDEIRDRIIQILDFLEQCERHHGAWSHWYNADTGETQPFSPDDDGGDIVETSFVAAGLIALRSYFDGTDEKSQQIRETATMLWEEIEWDWYRNGQNLLLWHWSPNIGFQKNMAVRGWNETLITYIMAAASPTFGIPAEVYDNGYARNGNMVIPRTFYGHPVTLSPDWGGPLFWIHYTHLGIDPRGLRDKYADYWQEHVNTARIHHAYAVDNPLNHSGYGEGNWGLTASDDPDGYTAHQPLFNDNGTISPTASLASFPYTPEESMKALDYFYRERGQDLFGRFGFYDAFNDNRDWVQQAYIGIDQGPILLMIENYRSALLWELVMKDPDVRSGLDLLGFQYQTVSTETAVESGGRFTLFPNPARERFSLLMPEELKGKNVQLKIYGTDGSLLQAEEIASAPGEVTVNTSMLKKGLYLVQVLGEGICYSMKLIIDS